ncbi:MAG: MFS transporter [Phycisphaerales bacterium]
MTTNTGSPLVTVRLSAMMFLQFFLWGAWYVTLGTFLNGHKVEGGVMGWAYSTAPIGAIIAPIFLGMIADRFFATQKVLALMHILGGVALIAAPRFVPESGTSVEAWTPFLGILILHMLCYMPTLGLSNTLAFANMTNPEKQFPPVRVLGTIGWIVANWVAGYVSTGDTDVAKATNPTFFMVAGISGIVLGLYSFTMPNTPPPAKGKPFSFGAALGFDALSQLKDKNFAVFMLSSFLVCIPLAAYYAYAASYAGMTGIAAEKVPQVMSYGQISEIFFMLIMPFFFARLGVKWMLAVGMLAWVVRYGLFGQAWGGTGGEHVQWMVLGGIVLHGICYDFFFVTGQIYVDKKCDPAIRGQAQGLLVLFTQGLGMLVGAQLFPKLIDMYTKDGVTDWRMVWFVPAAFAGAVMLLFLAMFNQRNSAQSA